MTITNLEQKENRKLWVPIRDGNRGGWSLFNWEDVRDKSHKEREMYLGNSVTLGVLDKGGKWRKRDWYTKAGKKYQSDNLETEHEEAMRRDKQRMSAALNQSQMDDQKLTDQQMKQLLKRVKMKREGVESEENEIKGLGFGKNKLGLVPAAKIDSSGAHKLAGISEEQGENEGQAIKREYREPQLQKSGDSSQKRRKDKKHKKKHKRDRSHEKSSKKKHKSKHKDRERSRSRSKDNGHRHSKHRRYSSSPESR